jgi:hypothetical protein
MFVRFRERKSGGIRPTKILCEGRCMHASYRPNQCHMRPRCRWHIGVDQGLEDKLEPYQLLVDLIDNRRVDGKVKQEHIAALGTVEGYLMPGFFAGVDAAVVEQIVQESTDAKGGRSLSITRHGIVFRCYSWQRASLERRIDFWTNLHEVLSRLSNRIDAATAAKIMDAVNARIPMPMVDEIEGTPLRERESGLAEAESDHASSLSMVEQYKELAAKAQDAAETWRLKAEFDAERISRWRAEVDRLKTAPEPR